jgi:hypothetical protein
MTEEQKARRAAVARQNGAKSRGPVSDLGKYIASLNSIATGEHLEILKEELPECIALLSSDCWISYLRLYQKHLRQLQPASECEQTLVRHMCVELFQLERTISLETYARQCLLDASLRAYSEMPSEMRDLTSYEKGLEKEKLWRSLQRDKKSHQSAYASHYKMFKQIRRDFPLVPPEPISTDADQNGAAPALPTPEVVKEMLDHADRAKNEPNYQLPRWVANMLLDDEMMAEIAPSYDVTALLEKLTVSPVPLAA